MSFLSIRSKWAKTKGKTASAITRRAPPPQPPQPAPSSAISSESFSSPYIVEITDPSADAYTHSPPPPALSPHVNLELSTEPWFPTDLFSSESSSASLPHRSLRHPSRSSTPYKQNPAREEVIVLSPEDGPITDIPEDDDSAASGGVWEDVAVLVPATAPPRRLPKPAPTPIIIPEHARLPSKGGRRRSSRGHSTGTHSALLSVKPDPSSPVYRDDDDSVISGITLPGALIGGSFAVQTDFPRDQRLSRRITRTDSATLPRGEVSFLSSPRGRSSRQGSGQDWARFVGAPPVPPLLIPPGGDRGSHPSSVADSPIIPPEPAVDSAASESAPAPAPSGAGDGNVDENDGSPTSTTSEAPPLSQTPAATRVLQTQTDTHPMHRISRITEASSPSLSSPATPERARDSDSHKSGKLSLASPRLPHSPSPTSSYHTHDLPWDAHESKPRPGSRSSGRLRGSMPLEVQVSRPRPSSRSVGSFLLHPDKFLPLGDRRVSTHPPSNLHRGSKGELEEEGDHLVGLPSAALFSGQSESVSHLPAFPESARLFPESARLPRPPPDTASTLSSSGSPDTDELTSPDPLDNVLLSDRRATAKTDAENTPVTSPSSTPLNHKQTFPETPSEFSPFFGAHTVPASESVSRTSSLNRGARGRSAARRMMNRPVSVKANAHRKRSKSRSRRGNRADGSVYTSPSAATSRTFQEARPNRGARAVSEIHQPDSYTRYEQEAEARAAAAAPHSRIITNVPPPPLSSPPPPPPPPKLSTPPTPRISPPLPPLPKPSPRAPPAQLPLSQSIGPTPFPPTLSSPPPPRTPPPPRSQTGTPSTATDATPTPSTAKKASATPNDDPPDYAAATSSTTVPAPSHAPSASTSSLYGTPPRRAAGRPPGPLGPRSRIASVSVNPRVVSQAASSSGSIPLSHRESVRRPSDASIMSVSVRATPKFHRTQVKFKGHSMEAAQWVLSSEELQTIVSKSIKQSAEPNFIRLLSLQALETDIPAEVRRLEALQAELKTRYKVQVRKRNVLLTAASTQADGGEVNVQHLRAKLDDLRAVTESMDDLAEQLYDARDQSAQLVRLASMHSSSALAVALRKLNASFLKRTKEAKELADKVAELEEERDEAWAAAQRVAQDLDELNDTILEHQDALSAGSRSGTASLSRSTSRRSSQIMASRKSSLRVSKAGLRNGARRSNRESTSSSGNRASLMSSVAGTASPVDVPPVPPIPTRRVSYRNSGYVSDMSPTTETREGAQALRDVLNMLGMDMDMDDAPAKSALLQRRASLGAASPSVYSPRTAASFRFPLGSARSPISARSPGAGFLSPMQQAGAGLSSSASALLGPDGRPRSRSVSMLEALQGTREEDVERKAVLATLDTGMMDA